MDLQKIPTIPGHGPSLHASIFIESPSHSFPPPIDSVMIDLFATLSPLPHVFEQVDQFPNGDQTQSTWEEVFILFIKLKYVKISIITNVFSTTYLDTNQSYMFHFLMPLLYRVSRHLMHPVQFVAWKFWYLPHKTQSIPTIRYKKTICNSLK